MAANENLAVFVYEARTPDGRHVEGKTKAQNQQVVTEMLIKNGFTPLSVGEQTALQKDIKFGSGSVKPKLVAQFMRQFATLNDAGIPITRSLSVLRDQQDNPALKAALNNVKNDIDEGLSLGAALERHPTVFTPLTSAMVSAGEKGGFLTETLKSVAETLEADVKLKAQIKSAMTYPVAVLGLAAVLVTAMLIFIVPIFDNMFSSLGGELPIATQILVSASEFIKVGGVPTAIVIAGFVWWWNRNKHKDFIRRFMDPLKLKLPIFGKLNQKIMIARFTQNFAALLDAGLPVMQVLDIVGSTSGNTIMEEALVEVKKGVANGETIAPQLAKHAIFPKMLVEMMEIGEGAGEVPQMMTKVAKSYNEEVETMTASLSSLMEPLMLMVLGVVVGGMVIAMYMPIFSIYDLIE